MGPYAGVDYNLTLCPLQSRLLQHMYHRQPYTIGDLNPMPELTLSLRQGLRNLASGLYFSVHILEEKTCGFRAKSYFPAHFRKNPRLCALLFNRT